MKRLSLTLLLLAASAMAWAQEIPSYYHEGGYLEKKIEQIKANVAEAKRGVTFPYLTDGHWRDNGKQSFPLIDYIRKQVKMPFTIYGGDNIFAFGSKESAMEEAEYYLQMMKQYPTVYGVKGNHDITIRNGWHDTGGYTATQELIYDYTTRPIAKYVKGVEGKSYYYWDDKKQDVRYIVLDLFENINTSISWGVNYGVTQEQVDWLVNKALKCKNKTLVILTHAPLDPKLGGAKEMRFLHEIFIALQNRWKFSYNEGVKVESDFSTSTNTVACIISGHTHRDESSFDRGVLSISTICDAWYNDDPKFKHLPRQRGTINEQAFDIMTINTASRTIKAVRIGQGKDREWSYASSYALRNKKTNYAKRIEKKNTNNDCIEIKIKGRLASFMGGDLNSFRKWVEAQINSADRKIEYGIEARAMIEFTISENGDIDPKQVRLLQYSDKGLAKEAMRVIRTSPQWSPAIEDGKPKEVRYTIPISLYHRQ